MICWSHLDEGWQGGWCVFLCVTPTSPVIIITHVQPFVHIYSIDSGN